MGTTHYIAHYGNGQRGLNSNYYGHGHRDLSIHFYEHIQSGLYSQ